LTTDSTGPRAGGPDASAEDPWARSFLVIPPEVPHVDLPVDATAVVVDLDVSGRYLPAGLGPEPIAGDFYDVLRLGPDLVALVLGDVSGHGTEAAQRMRQLRAATRAYALELCGPASLLDRLDRFVERLDNDHIATLWYGEYQPSTGVLRYGSAGHLPPVLRVHGQPAERLEPASSPPLGTGVAGEHAVEQVTVIPPGAVLVTYSDGLVERPGTDIDEQIALLAELLTTACDPARAQGAQAIADELMDALVPVPGKARDDVCLLVARRTPEA
jgi:serine phosphatase RsbU (regulator of sigma subunit)